MINHLLFLDESFFYWFNNLSGKNYYIDTTGLIIGKYLVYLVPILLVFFWFYSKKDKVKIDLVKSTLVSVFIWQIPTRIIAFFWNRPRPFVNLAETKELFFHIPSYSFPSDHATFLAAISMYFYLLGYKKVGYMGFVTTFLVGIFRIIAGMHYPLDIICGWALGVMGSWIIYKYTDKIINKLAKYILKIARYIKLA
jgi:undecaprenyl-diphosphatase